MAGWIDALERESGLHVPPAVREWYSVRGAVEWLARHSDNILVSAAGLGDPIDGLDYLDGGRLVTETDAQCCWRWAVRLRPPRYEGEPLFHLPGAPPATLDEDPPVWIIDPDDDDPFEQLYADRFSEYVLTSVWTAQAFGKESFFTDDDRLPRQALDTLRQRYVELPTTYAWAGNQPCDAVYRFTGPARVMIAVQGQTALHTVVATDSEQELARIRAVLDL
ncbi:hypothetical protein KZZ52_28335 [Dactylosporangium sp. AC04546]|uniref:hypothetical protein n=1 Tax=Dactylosporangium sp. AC04546 TaxID=2862460 RepID=UPI001EE05F84|nr:hypothetical protein [Dactylosporangium sp. AC04546]WVK89178.1 hypothetical protein KZZ52_28335 [Dactylosporangium sp. AC04546]